MKLTSGVRAGLASLGGATFRENYFVHAIRQLLSDLATSSVYYSVIVTLRADKSL